MGQALEMCKHCETRRDCDDCDDLRQWIAERLDSEPVRHGKWGSCGIAAVCDQCNLHIVVEQYSEGDIKYCPNCGAKMDGGAE